MTASHADPVDVQRRDGSPVAFCWRGRVYLVQGVLAHWLETGPWWQSASVRALLTTGVPHHHPAPSHPATPQPDPHERQPHPYPRAPQQDQPHHGQQQGERASQHGQPHHHGQRDLQQGERQPQQGERAFWQVEAAPGRHGTPGVFELCADLATETPTWSVTTLTAQPAPPDRSSP